MLRERRRRRRRASGEKLAAVMPAKFDAIMADDDSARHAHIDSRANKAVRETERLCRIQSASQTLWIAWIAVSRRAELQVLVENHRSVRRHSCAPPIRPV